MSRGGRKKKIIIAPRLWGLLEGDKDFFSKHTFTSRDIFALYINQYGPKAISHNEFSWVLTQRFDKPDSIILDKNERGRWTVAFKEN